MSVPIPSYTYIDQYPELLEKFKEIRPVIDMSVFRGEPLEDEVCGTSCCIAGWAIEWNIGPSDTVKHFWNSRRYTKAGNIYIDDAISNSGDPRDGMHQQMTGWIFHGGWQLQIGPERQYETASKRLQYIIDHKSCPAVTFSYQNKVQYSTVSISELLEAIPTCEIVSGGSAEDYIKFGLFVGLEPGLFNPLVLSPKYPLEKIPDTLLKVILQTYISGEIECIAIPTEHTELALQLLSQIEQL